MAAPAGVPAITLDAWRWLEVGSGVPLIEAATVEAIGGGHGDEADAGWPAVAGGPVAQHVAPAQHVRLVPRGAGAQS